MRKKRKVLEGSKTPKKSKKAHTTDCNSDVDTFIIHGERIGEIPCIEYLISKNGSTAKTWCGWFALLFFFIIPRERRDKLISFGNYPQILRYESRLAQIKAEEAFLLNSPVQSPDSTDIDQEFKIKKLVAKRGKSHTVHYLVKWDGYDSSHDSWYTHMY
jgi:hypothetical protein